MNALKEFFTARLEFPWGLKLDKILSRYDRYVHLGEFQIL